MGGVIVSVLISSVIATDHNQPYSKITTESVRKECGRFPAADSTLKAKYEYCFYSLAKTGGLFMRKIIRHSRETCFFIPPGFAREEGTREHMK
jgi:hypothetical protein